MFQPIRYSIANAVVGSLLLGTSIAQQSLTACPVTPTTITLPDGLTYAICPGSDYQVSSNIIQGNVADSTTCLKLCDANTGCQKAVYDHVNLICHLKGNPSPANWVSSGQYDSIQRVQTLQTGTVVSTCPVTEIRQVMPNGQTSIICSNTDYTVPSYLIQSSISSDVACAQLCSQNAGCAKAVYDRVNSICHLKGTVGPSSWVYNPQYEAIRIVSSGTSTTTSSIVSTVSTFTTKTTSASISSPNPSSTNRPQTPIMGYNSYNDVACSPNDALMRSAIQAMSDKGFLNLGYKYFQIDCGWQGYNRLPNGSITYDSTRFPNGIASLSNFATGLGFLWSMYTDQGVYSCDTSYNPHRPGSLGYETQDAAMFAAWNVQYVKVDNCFVDPNDNAPKNPLTDFPTRYSAIWKALQAVGIPKMLICQWGTPYLNTSTNTLQGPTAWAPAVSTSFRISDDISQGWTAVLRIYNQAIHACLLNLVGPGRFADMDLLEVGNPGLTFDEQKTHFAIWSTFKSALMISTSVPQMTTQTASIFGNKDLIAVNQDPLGLPVKLIQRFSNNYDIFLGPLANGDQVLLVVDQSNTVRSLTVQLATIGIASASVKDLWAGQSLGSLSAITQTVNAHGSMVFRLSAVQLSPPSSVQFQSFEAETATLANGAYSAGCSTCSGGQKVGGLVAGSSASVTFTNIRTSQTTANVLFDYINCEVQYLGSNVPNIRTASISVNGGAPVSVLFPLTGYNWNGDVLPAFKVQLSGFSTQGPNTITVQSASGQGDAPDIDRIRVPN